MGSAVNSSNTSGFYPAQSASTFQTMTGQPVPGVMLPDNGAIIDSITIPATSAQDQAMQNFMNQQTQNPGSYDLNNRNCATTVGDTLRAGGFNTPNTIFPRSLFRNLQQQFPQNP